MLVISFAAAKLILCYTSDWYNIIDLDIDPNIYEGFFILMVCLDFEIDYFDSFNCTMKLFTSSENWVAIISLGSS